MAVKEISTSLQIGKSEINPPKNIKRFFFPNNLRPIFGWSDLTKQISQIVMSTKHPVISNQLNYGRKKFICVIFSCFPIVIIGWAKGGSYCELINAVR